MSDIDISPLAKRLAEENNVNWRVLNGTGDAGKIVERDVLDYLARVMAGEADMDPTPEPLPSGMDAWSDADPGFNGSDSPWSRGGEAESGWDSGDAGLLEQDTPASRADDDWAAPDSASAEATPADSASYEATADFDAASDFDATPDFDSGSDLDAVTEIAGNGDTAPEIDEDIFVFDDEPETLSSADRGRDSASWADDAGFDKREVSESGNDFGDDDFFALRDDRAATPSTDSSGFSWDDPVASRAESSGSEPGAELDFGAVSEETGATLFDGTVSEKTSSDGTVFDSTMPGSQGEPTPWGDEETLHEETLHEETLHEETLSNASGEATPWGGSETASSLDSVQSEPDTPWEAAETFEQPIRDSWQDAGISGGRDLFEQPPSDSWQDVPTTGSAHDAGGDESGWKASSGKASSDLGLETDEGFGGDDYPVAAESGAAAHSVPAAGSAGWSSGPAETSAFRAAAPRQVPTGLRNISGGGIALRRDVDLTALWQAQRAIAQELGLEEMVSPASFLLRAAARAGRPWPFISPGDVPSRAVLSDAGVLAERVPDAGTMAFRELVALCSHPPKVGGDEDMMLAVADLSVLDIDEAILDLGCPVLTLGRILPRSQSDRFHGTITLSGPVAPDAGARFLGRVVELLAAPVRLVL